MSIPAEQCANICATSIFPQYRWEVGCNLSMRETISSTVSPSKRFFITRFSWLRNRREYWQVTTPRELSVARGLHTPDILCCKQGQTPKALSAFMDQVDGPWPFISEAMLTQFFPRVRD